MFRGIARLDWEGFFPVQPVAILKYDRDGRSNSFAVVHAREKVGAIGFDFHSTAASEALLAAPEFAVDEFLIDGQAGGQSGEKSHQGFAVRFSGGKVTQHVEEAL